MLLQETDLQSVDDSLVPWCHLITCTLQSSHIQLRSLIPGVTRPGYAVDGAHQLAATIYCHWTVWVTRGVCFECPPICRSKGWMVLCWCVLCWCGSFCACHSHIVLMVLIPDNLRMEDQVRVRVCMHVRCITHTHTHTHTHVHMHNAHSTCTHTGLTDDFKRVAR